MKARSTRCIDVPLGSALTDTILEVRKGETKITNGEGELWIGEYLYEFIKFRYCKVLCICNRWNEESVLAR